MRLKNVARAIFGLLFKDGTKAIEQGNTNAPTEPPALKPAESTDDRNRETLNGYDPPGVLGRTMRFPRVFFVLFVPFVIPIMHGADHDFIKTAN